MLQKDRHSGFVRVAVFLRERVPFRKRPLDPSSLYQRGEGRCWPVLAEQRTSVPHLQILRLLSQCIHGLLAGTATFHLVGQQILVSNPAHKHRCGRQQNGILPTSVPANA